MSTTAEEIGSFCVSLSSIKKIYSNFEDGKSGNDDISLQFFNLINGGSIKGRLLCLFRIDDQDNREQFKA